MKKNGVFIYEKHKNIKSVRRKIVKIKIFECSFLKTANCYKNFLTIHQKNEFYCEKMLFYIY